ncbi:MAG: hypothetical protein N3C60_02950, partial [Calditerrivibrio sp.]|nr:hypothetical protein [Calditerrivibrio sp.]
MKQISKILFIIIMLVSLAYANQYKFPIQAFEFENMVWVFTKGDETFKVKFGKGGIIEGYPRSDLVRWEIKDGFLLLMGKNNSLAVKFDSYNLENDGWTLLGVSLVDGYKPAVLKEGSGDVVKSKQEKQKSFESGGDAIVRSDSDVYVENQKITVEFYNLPG